MSSESVATPRVSDSSRRCSKEGKAKPTSVSVRCRILPQPPAEHFAEEVLGELFDHFELPRPLVFAQVRLAVLFKARQIERAFAGDYQCLDDLALFRVGNTNHGR